MAQSVRAQSKRWLGMGSVLVGLHMESVLAGESSTISRNWPAL